MQAPEKTYRASFDSVAQKFDLMYDSYAVQGRLPQSVKRKFNQKLEEMLLADGWTMAEFETELERCANANR